MKLESMCEVEAIVCVDVSPQLLAHPTDRFRTIECEIVCETKKITKLIRVWFPNIHCRMPPHFPRLCLTTQENILSIAKLSSTWAGALRTEAMQTKQCLLVCKQSWPWRSLRSEVMPSMQAQNYKTTKTKTHNLKIDFACALPTSLCSMFQLSWFYKSCCSGDTLRAWGPPLRSHF